MTPTIDVKEYFERLFKVDINKFCKQCREDRRRKEDEENENHKEIHKNL